MPRWRPFLLLFNYTHRQPSTQKGPLPVLPSIVEIHISLFLSVGSWCSDVGQLFKESHCCQSLRSWRCETFLEKTETKYVTVHTDLTHVSQSGSEKKRHVITTWGSRAIHAQKGIIVKSKMSNRGRIEWDVTLVWFLNLTGNSLDDCQERWTQHSKKKTLDETAERWSNNQILYLIFYCRNIESVYKYAVDSSEKKQWPHQAKLSKYNYARPNYIVL